MPGKTPVKMPVQLPNTPKPQIKRPSNPRPVPVKRPSSGKGNYDWVECGSCDAGWQVAHYAESVG